MTENKIIFYNIWKVTGHYSGTRYYESEKTFIRNGLNRLDNKLYPGVKAYRFTSEGWKEVNNGKDKTSTT